MLALLGPLIAQAFTTAVNTYAEVSRGGLPQALSPLDGILVPTFGIYDLAAMLLFPFVAIRAISAERDSGAWTLLQQAPPSVARMVAAKAATLLGAWIVAWTPGILALGLWMSYGGHLNAGELSSVLAGYFLRGLLTIGIAMAAAAITRSASSAAIVTLAFTVGTWVLDFIAAGRGGRLAMLAAYTPANALRAFETGLLSPGKSVALAGVAGAGIALASIWMAKGLVARKALLLAVALVTLAFGVARIPPSADIDLSEDRRNSFSPEDERALRAISQTLTVTVHLAPEDPRLTDLEHNILAKLTRTLPHFAVIYDAPGRTGLFDNSHYGEVWYEMSGQRVMSRSTTEPVLLEVIYALAHTQAAAASHASYSGYPLDASPRYAWLLLGVLWPLAMAVLCWCFLYAHT